MIPVTQFILGNSDPLLYPSEKMTNSIDEQIAFLQSQKQAINEAYRRNAIPNANNGTTQNQQVPTQGIWDAIDAEIAPLTQEQQNMLLNNQDYVNNYNALQSMVQAEVLPNDVEPCDVYVAINAQYHDYAKLFEEWFGGNIDNKVFESAITFWFKDVDFDGDKVWEYFHMNN
nr:MAG: hypothetical protein [Bacteriophage sp.]